MSSPANRSEVLAASDTGPVITGEAPQAEEPSAIKVFFTAPGSNLEFYPLSPTTTGWDIVKEKGCFAQVDTSNLRIVHRSTTIDLSSKIMEHLPDLREGDTVEFRSISGVEVTHAPRSQSSQGDSPGSQASSPPNPNHIPPGPALVRVMLSAPRREGGEVG